MRIFIACADDKLRLALLYLLDHEAGLVVAGMADRLSGLVSQLEGAQPEVLILDWELSTEPMLDLMDKLRDLKCQTKVIVLSSNPQVKEAALAAGADFFINKNTPPDELIPMLNEISSTGEKKRTTNL